MTAYSTYSLVRDDEVIVTLPYRLRRHRWLLKLAARFVR